MLSGLLAVDEHFGTLVDTLEMELDQFTLLDLHEVTGKTLAIFTLSGGKPATLGACSSCLGIGSVIDVPIVWKINGCRLAVVRKLPAIVKQLLFLRRCL